jgi:hypothetical protein
MAVMKDDPSGGVSTFVTSHFAMKTVLIRFTAAV